MTDIEIKVRSIYDTLSPSMQKAADYFLAHADTIFEEPIASLSDKSGVSQVMWVRFCKTLGFSGLKEMKSRLFRDLATQIEEQKRPAAFSDTSDFSDLAEMMRAVTSRSILALENTLKLQNEELIEETVSVLHSAGRILCFGIGASALVAEDLYFKAVRIGLPCMYHQDIHVIYTYISTMKKGDVAILISDSGRTKEIVALAEYVKEKGASLISVSKYGTAPLVSLADICLFTSSDEIRQRSGAMASRMAALLVVDFLFSAYCNRHFDEVEPLLAESYGKFHNNR